MRELTKLILILVFLIALTCIALEWLVYFNILNQTTATRVLFGATPILFLIAVLFLVGVWTRT